MFSLRRSLALLFLFIGLVGPLVGATAGVPRLGDGGRGERVVIADLSGTVDLGLAASVRRAMIEAEDAAAIVLVIDTFGGRVDAAVQIRDQLLDTKVPTVAYVERRAISAGALIAYASDTLVFGPGSTMGAATPIELRGGEAAPVDEKFVSYFRAEMRATAEANGRDGAVAEAMVDRTLTVPGIDDTDQLLTVTEERAVEIGLADGTAATLDALLAEMGLADAERVAVETSWSEELVRFVTDPVVASLLMSLGMLGLVVELYSPGFGLPGTVGIVCLSLFFGGHLLADLAGWEDALLVLAGIVCLAVEVFVLPGFGIVGVTGIVLLVVGLASSMVGMPLDIAWNLGLLESAIGRVGIALVVALVGTGLLVRLIPARMWPRWLVLRDSLGESAATRANPEYSYLLGQSGEAATDLRPSGKARFGDELVDVVSRLDYLPRGSAVVVVEVEGGRVVVDRPRLV